MPRLSDIEHYEKVRDGWLIDTNILSAIMGKRDAHPGIKHFFENVPDDRLRISVVTIGEIQKGISLIRFAAGMDPATRNRSAKAAKRDMLQAKLEVLETRWEDRIVPIDTRVSRAWGELQAHYQARGTPVPAVDSLIAATAYVHNLVVVSNDGVFERMRDRISLYDPLNAKT